MLKIVVTPEREMRANHERDRAVEARPAQQKQSQVMGALEAARLLDRREFIFHGRPYRVPPLPFRLAAELLDVQERLRKTAPGAPLHETLEVFERAARLSKRACHPAGFLRRLFWPITRNPFAQATPWQVGRNLGFFSMCLILDGDHGIPGASPVPGTSPATSPASSPATRNGRGRTATRSRGATS